MKRQGGCRCGLSKSDGFLSVGSLLALFGLFDYRARPGFCVCVSRGAHSLFCFFLPHPRGCRTTDSTRTRHSRYSTTVCQSTKPFDCVSTLTDAVALTRCVYMCTVVVSLYCCCSCCCEVEKCRGFHLICRCCVQGGWRHKKRLAFVVT